MGDPKKNDEACKCNVGLVPYLYRYNRNKKKWEWRPRVRGDQVKRGEWVKVTATMKCSNECTAHISISVDATTPRGTLRLGKTPHLVDEQSCTHYQERIYWTSAWLKGGQPNAIVTFRADADCDPCKPRNCTGTSTDYGKVKFVQ